MKQKTIKIGEQEVTFSTSALIPLLYRNTFNGYDIFADIQDMIEIYSNTTSGTIPPKAIEICERVAYIFAKHTAIANKEDMLSIEEWFMQFDTFDIYMVMEEVIGLWLEENEVQSKQKKRTTKKQTGK